MAQERPAFVDDLLRRSLPLLHPPGVTDTQNPPFSSAIASKIVDGRYHPLLEVLLCMRLALHLRAPRY